MWHKRVFWGIANIENGSGHGHVLQYGEFLNSVDLFGSNSLEDVRGRLESYLSDHPNAGTRKEWLRGLGWDQMALGQMPTAVSASLEICNTAGHLRNAQTGGPCGKPSAQRSLHYVGPR